MVPHSITNWTLNSAFWNPGEGLCLGTGAEISSFKKTFLVVNAPDFAFVGEQIEIRVYAYNYDKHHSTVFFYVLMSETKEIVNKINNN